MENDLISRSELKKAIIKRLGIKSEEFLLASERTLYDEIDNAPTVNEVRVIDTNVANNSGNALLKDIAHSLAIIADNSMKNGNSQESGNEVLHWVHSEAHKVMCPKCGCRVSINAAYEMNYCFKCGAELGGIKNEHRADT